MSDKPHILICTPCYGNQLFQTYFMSMIKFLIEVQKRNHPFYVSFSVRGGDSLITRLRNSMTAEFLSKPQYTHLLWVDADIGFEPDMIFKLLESGHEIATGVYPLKSYPLPEKVNTSGQDELVIADLISKYMRYPFNPVGAQFDIIKGFVEVKDAPTGMMMIKRSVFDKMVKAYPELKYDPDRQIGLENLANSINDYYYNFFDTIIAEDEYVDPKNPETKLVKKRYLSEDYAFCRLWQRIGGKVYAYAFSKLTHTGSHMFEGDLKRFFDLNYSVIPHETPSTAPVAATNTPPAILPTPSNVTPPPIIPAADISNLLNDFQKNIENIPEENTDTPSDNGDNR